MALKSAVKGSHIVEPSHQFMCLLEKPFYWAVLSIFNINFYRILVLARGADLSLGCFTGW